MRSSGNEPVPGKISHRIISVKEIKEFAEIREDEYIILSTSKKQDEDVMTFLEKKETDVNKGKEQYKADSFNCTSLASEALEQFVYKKEDDIGSQEIKIQVEVPLTGKKIILTAYVDAPNKLYNDLKNRKEVKEKSSEKKLDENQTQEFVNNHNQ